MSSEYTVRKYGKSPFRVAVVHGGPGAPGSAAPLAVELSRDRGVLEPLQMATSVDGQVRELRDQLQSCADLPITLIGHSWGAWLACLVAPEYPECVDKLILVGSGPFEAGYAEQIQSIRMSRLTDSERDELDVIQTMLNDPTVEDKCPFLAKFGSLFMKLDTYAPIPSEEIPCDAESIPFQYDTHVSVWEEAAELRRSGQLQETVRRIHCPVVAIHGDYDPHPAEGVEKPLSGVLSDFKFILLDRCGHEPWIERYAREAFFNTLRQELI